MKPVRGAPDEVLFKHSACLSRVFETGGYLLAIRHTFDATGHGKPKNRIRRVELWDERN
jgi:hypothetical protein